jgi:hypothetical protein
VLAVAATEAYAFVAIFRDAAASGVMNWRFLPTPEGLNHQEVQI